MKSVYSYVDWERNVVSEETRLWNTQCRKHRKWSIQSKTNYTEVGLPKLHCTCPYNWRILQNVCSNFLNKWMYLYSETDNLINHVIALKFSKVYISIFWDNNSSCHAVEFFRTLIFFRVQVTSPGVCLEELACRVMLSLSMFWMCVLYPLAVMSRSRRN